MSDKVDYKDREPLKKDQVEMAKLFLADLHPIANTGIEKAFPYTLFWIGWIK
jgi:hypothetical protein